MENNNSESFTAKFDKLTPANQMYIIAIQQALILIQTKEHDEKICLTSPAKQA